MKKRWSVCSKLPALTHSWSTDPAIPKRSGKSFIRKRTKSCTNTDTLPRNCQRSWMRAACRLSCLTTVLIGVWKRCSSNPMSFIWATSSENPQHIGKSSASDSRSNSAWSFRDQIKWKRTVRSQPILGQTKPQAKIEPSGREYRKHDTLGTTASGLAANKANLPSDR